MNNKGQENNIAQPVGGEEREKYEFLFSASKEAELINAKIMDSIKTDHGQTVTNQSDILYVPKNRFC